jgi:hypothetical protein
MSCSAGKIAGTSFHGESGDRKMVIPNIDHEHRLYGLPLRRSFGGPSARAARRIAGESGRVGALVVGGFRYNEGKPVVGSLLLGLYDRTAFCITSASPRRYPATTRKR